MPVKKKPRAEESTNVEDDGSEKKQGKNTGGFRAMLESKQSGRDDSDVNGLLYDSTFSFL